MLREDAKRPAAAGSGVSPRRPASPEELDGAPTMSSTTNAAAELQRLEAEAHYHRDRLALYRARVLSARPASPSRLRELERTSAGADERLRHARGR
jgi:hypothetical protein